ncbi:MAG: OmpH family outer membrane protein [Dysgonamonadaceae bacterium]|jgi:outer membrane protein|nr:OmpH family outer membrane protein [Dysgonamonadaceae bacterium]
MNKNYIINGVLGIAVIVLFILHFTNKKAACKDDAVAAGDSTVVRLPVAYINSDSLLLNYGYAEDLRETLLRKAESSRATLTQKGNKLQADMLEFQRKYENNAFLSPQRAQEEHASLMKRQQDLQDQAERIQQEFVMEQMRMNQQMTDTVVAALKTFNETTNYQIIFQNVNGNSPILLADDVYNITKEVTEYLNKRYTPAKKTK